MLLQARQQLAARRPLITSAPTDMSAPSSQRAGRTSCCRGYAIAPDPLVKYTSLACPGTWPREERVEGSLGWMEARGIGRGWDSCPKGIDILPGLLDRPSLW